MTADFIAPLPYPFPYLLGINRFHTTRPRHLLQQTLRQEHLPSLATLRLQGASTVLVADSTTNAPIALPEKQFSVTSATEPRHHIPGTTRASSYSQQGLV